MTYGEFWRYYLAAHADRRSRALHYLGTVAALVLIAVAAASADWRWLVAVPFAGYGPAWVGHAVFERNRPATFEHPLWSLWGDVRMLGLFLTARLASELRRRTPPPYPPARGGGKGGGNSSLTRGVGGRDEIER